MRLCFLLLSIILSLSTLNAQQAGRSQASGIFPITLVLEGADYAAFRSVWRPDWPPRLPVDAFKVLSGEVSRVTVEGEGISLNLSFGAEGLLEEFPFMMNGRMAQVGLVYNEFLERKEMHLTFPSWDESDTSGDTPDGWKLEFLEYRNSFPYLVRASRMGVWYFIYFSGTMDEILETWYDATGNFVGAFAFSLIEIGNEKRISAMRDYLDLGAATEFFYDSRGLLTEAAGPTGLYKVLYFREDLTRYWEHRPIGEQWEGAFQYDEAFFIPRATGEAGDGPFDYRYEYTVDERSNWVERRVIQMIYQDGVLQPGLLQSGLLVPWPGLTYRRVLEYRE